MINDVATIPVIALGVHHLILGNKCRMQFEIIIICNVVFATIQTVHTELCIDSKRSNTRNSPTEDIAKAGKSCVFENSPNAPTTVNETIVSDKTNKRI